MPQLNNHSFDLKHRLVGAAVLIVVAIVVLPLVLTGQKHGHRHVLKSNRDAMIPIQQTFISRVEVDRHDIAEQQSPLDIAKDESKSRKLSDIEESTKDVKNQGIGDDRPMTSSIELPSGWIVGVGVFQVPENAKKRQALLDENGFSVNVEEAELNGKPATRVFLGPFSSKDEAERMKAQAVMVTNDHAFVTRYP